MADETREGLGDQSLDDTTAPGDDESPTKPTVLDLDDEPEDLPRLPVILGGERYYIQHRFDLSFAESLELSSILQDVAAIREKPEGKGKRPSVAQVKLLDALELDLCRIALPDAPAEVINKLKGPDNDTKRGRLISAFLGQPGVIQLTRAMPWLLKPAPSVPPTPPTPLTRLRDRQPPAGGSSPDSPAATKAG